ncbi:unnamed protein product [Cylicocyclus nassatus]|uniref:Uncharacterized protein n=1 Tax=Cylicocyclus nassatus TaxID=53992 RepID=A0AA36HFM8_CYLNA|nr:unnamed protein product [Cylicocyclus nassatus]
MSKKSTKKGDSKAVKVVQTPEGSQEENKKEIDNPPKEKIVKAKKEPRTTRGRAVQKKKQKPKPMSPSDKIRFRSKTPLRTSKGRIVKAPKPVYQLEF